jgi:hypothetical protein
MRVQEAKISASAVRSSSCSSRWAMLRCGSHRSFLSVLKTANSCAYSSCNLLKCVLLDERQERNLVRTEAYFWNCLGVTMSPYSSAGQKRGDTMVGWTIGCTTIWKVNDAYSFLRLRMSIYSFRILNITSHIWSAASPNRIVRISIFRHYEGEHVSKIVGMWAKTDPTCLFLHFSILSSLIAKSRCARRTCSSFTNRSFES